MKVHPLAHVHDDCTIGEGTTVWQFASVIRGASIGAGCTIASGACIDGSRIGDRTKVAHNVAMGPGFIVGRDCFIGPNVTFCNDAWPRAHMSKFDARLYKMRPAIVVEDGASIGANAVILPGVRIGAGAMIGAGSVVGRDVPARFLWTGDGELEEIIHEPGNRMRFARMKAGDADYFEVVLDTRRG